MEPNGQQQAPQQSAGSEQMNEKTMAYLAYIIFFLPLIIGKPSAFVKYHVNQGLILIIFSVALQFVMTFLLFIPYLGILLQVLRFAPFVLWIIGIINVSKNEMKPLPFIGGFTLIS